MSMEQAQQFLAYVRNDTGLQAQLNGLRGRDAIKQLIQLAAENGFVFTESDYRAAIVEAADGELSEQSLDTLVQELGMRPQNPDR